MAAIVHRDRQQIALAQWRNGLAWAVALFVALRLVFSLYGLAVSTVAPVYAPCTAAAPAPLLHSGGLSLPLLGIWQRADGCMYEMIAANGYPPEDRKRFAFFPLYPALLRLAQPLFGGSWTLSGMAISALAYLAAATGLYRLAAGDFEVSIARRAVLYLSIFPSAFFLFAPFTESLFLACSVWTLYAARNRWWAWAGVLGCCAALTRTQGLFLVLPLLWELWRQWREAERADRRRWWPLLSLLGPACGFLAYNAYTYASAGLTVMGAQRLWGMRTELPWMVIIDSVRFSLSRGNPVEPTNLLLLLVFTGATIWGIGRVPLSYTLISAPQLLLLLTRETYHSPLMSVSRLLIVIFPVFIVLALAGRRPRLHLSWLILSLLLLAMLLTYFLGGPFVA